MRYYTFISRGLLSALFVALAALVFVSGVADAQNSPMIAGDVVVLGKIDGGNYPTSVQGGMLYDPIAATVYVGDGGTWAPIGAGATGSATAFTQQTSIPTTPAAGTSNFFVLGAMGIPYIQHPGGLMWPLLPVGAGGGRCWMAPQVSPASSNGPIILGIGSAAQGTAQNLPGVTVSTFLTSQMRMVVPATATANNAADIRAGYALGWRAAGFLFSARYGVVTVSADTRVFVGMAGTIGALTNGEPSALTDTAYFGCDSGDSDALRFCTNDNSGSANCTSLGANYPCRTANAVYDVWIYTPVGGASISYAIRRLDSAQFTVGNTATDLPTSTTVLGWHLWMNNGPSGSDADSIAGMWGCTWVP